MNTRIKIAFIEGPIGAESVSRPPALAPRGNELTFKGLAGANKRAVGIDKHERQLIRVHYEIDQTLAHDILVRICKEALAAEGSAEWSQILLLHSYGCLDVGDTSVYIQVTSPQSHATFTIGSYLLDQLQLRAPIWKKEIYSDGESEWLREQSLC